MNTLREAGSNTASYRHFFERREKSRLWQVTTLYYPEFHVAHISSIEVLQNPKRQGLGSVLVRGVLDDLDELECDIVYAVAVNPASVGLFSKVFNERALQRQSHAYSAGKYNDMSIEVLHLVPSPCDEALLYMRIFGGE